MSKPQLSRLTVFSEALEDIAIVLEHGEKKHGSDKNYLNYNLDLDIDASLRHTMQYMDDDDETGKPHIVHAICRLLFAYNKLKGIEK